MKITKVTFDCTIAMPGYNNVKPGASEIILEPGESPEQAWSELNRRAKEWHQKEFPHLYQNQQKELETTWKDETRADEFDNELAKEILALKDIEFREDAEEYLSRENWRKYNPALKSLVNAKPSRPVCTD